MSIGSLSSSTVSTGSLASAGSSVQSGKARQSEAQPAGARTIAEHVAAADAQEPIRSGSETLGTMVDTYL